MLKCKLCSFKCSFRTTMDGHLRKNHLKDNPLDMLRYFDDQGITLMETLVEKEETVKTDIISPDPYVIDNVSGRGGDFSGGGASSDY